MLSTEQITLIILISLQFNTALIDNTDTVDLIKENKILKFVYTDNIMQNMTHYPQYRGDTIYHES